MKRHVLFFRRGEAKTSKERFLPTIKAGQETKGEAQESGNLIKKMELTSPLCLSSFDPLTPHERERDALCARVS